MELELIRHYHPTGTNGTIYHSGQKLCDTIELPWLNNRRRISCIPEGRYKLYKRYTDRFGWHCRVENVPGREAILVHAFNHALKESKGCIAPVTQLQGWGKGSASKKALAKLLLTLNPAFVHNEPIFLTIQKDNHEYHFEKGATKDAPVL